MAFNELQSLILLCFYKYDKGQNITSFKDKFNQYFNTDFSEQTFVYELSIIRSAETSFNMQINDERQHYRELWYDYTQGRKKINTLDLYNNFKNTRMFAGFRNDNQLPIIKSQAKKTETKDEPIPYDNQTQMREDKQELRRQERKAQALINAGFKCELNCQHPLFYRKDGVTPYTEAHHLIPLRYQNRFQYSLDIIANLVSLCPSCHRELHYGSNIDELLYQLWEQRHERLEKCRIGIDYAELLQMYN